MNTTITSYTNQKILGDIYRMIYDNVQCSRQDLANTLNLSLPTVTKYLDQLREQNYIYDAGEFESTGGRKPRMLRYVANARYAMGIDITKNHLSLALINLNLDIIASKRMRLPFEETEEYFCIMQKEIEAMLENLADQKKLLGIGISMPAIIGEDQKSITYAKVIHASNNFYKKLENYIHFPFLFFNDSNSAGLAESWGQKATQPMIYLSLSGSVGGANITNHDIYTGVNWRSCEFGHITIVPDGKQCYCGQRGCLDVYCSANNLSNFTGGDLNVFFAELKKGENLGFIQVFDEYMDYLAIAVGSLRMCYDCDIVLGGTVGARMLDYMDAFRQKVIVRNPFEQDASFVKACHYRNEASAVGAAIYYINDFIQNF